MKTFSNGGFSLKMVCKFDAFLSLTKTVFLSGVNTVASLTFHCFYYVSSRTVQHRFHWRDAGSTYLKNPLVLLTFQLSTTRMALRTVDKRKRLNCK